MDRHARFRALIGRKSDDGVPLFRSVAALSRQITLLSEQSNRPQKGVESQISQFKCGHRPCPDWLQEALRRVISDRCGELSLDPDQSLRDLEMLLRRTRAGSAPDALVSAATNAIGSVVMLTHADDVRALGQIEGLLPSWISLLRDNTADVRVIIESGDPDHESRIGRRLLEALVASGASPTELEDWTGREDAATARLRFYRLRFPGSFAWPLVWFDGDIGVPRLAWVLPSGFPRGTEPMQLAAQLVEKLGARVVERIGVDEEEGRVHWSECQDWIPAKNVVEMTRDTRVKSNKKSEGR